LDGVAVVFSVSSSFLILEDAALFVFTLADATLPILPGVDRIDFDFKGDGDDIDLEMALDSITFFGAGDMPN
jgi:hypothetical protein